eukprot:SAG31_NODE_3949_length_3725_cov_1.821566_3_plen_63_part_00
MKALEKSKFDSLAVKSMARSKVRGYFLVFVQPSEKYGTLIERYTALIKKVSALIAQSSYGSP